MKNSNSENGTSNENEPTNEKTYHHGNLREALIEAGLELLELNESNKLSLREIARQVGVSANAVYRHFGNKEELLLALATEGFHRFKTSLKSETTQSPHEVVLHAGRAYIQFACNNPALFRLMFGPFAKQHCKEQQSTAANSSMDLLYSAIATANGLDIDDPRTTTAMMHAWGLVHGISHLLLDQQLQKIGGEQFDALIDATLKQAVYGCMLHMPQQ